MPGLRYGPDITDDAASLMISENKMKARLRAAQNPRAQQTIKARLARLNQTTQDVFGSRENRNRLAQYSLGNTGYARGNRTSGTRKALRSPLGGPAQKPGKTGFRARPGIKRADGSLYRQATARAKENAAEFKKSVSASSRQPSTTRAKAKQSVAKKAQAARKTPRKK